MNKKGGEYNFFLYIAMFFIHIINIKSDLYMKRLFFILWCINQANFFCLIID